MTDLRHMSVFRDVQAAMDFQQMAALGYLDTEFTMYGCVYWQDNQRQYVISSAESAIWQVLEDGQKEGCAMSPLASLTKVCPVPLGQKEAIAHQVKLALAEELQNDYPAAFWAQFNQMAAVPANDLARDVVEEACQWAAASFSQEQLDLAEGLLDMAYAGKVLTSASYQTLKGRLAHERDKLLEDVVAKDILEKRFYTLLYEAAPGRLKRVTNARREWICRKKCQLEKEGKVVAPIFARAYWYNNQHTLDEVKSWHEANCQRLLTEDYFAQVQAIAACPGPIPAQTYEAVGRTIGPLYGEKAGEMWAMYARRWHVSVESEVNV